MRSRNLLCVVLTVLLVVVSSSGDNAAQPTSFPVQPLWYLHALENASVKTASELGAGDAANLVDGKLQPQVRFGNVKGATFTITLNQPRYVNAIGVLRPAWSTWAKAATLDVRINNAKPLRVSLKKGDIVPNAKSIENIEADIIEIASEVRVMEITVVDTESISPYNIVGTLEVVEATRGPDVANLALVEGVPDNASGLRLCFDMDRPVAQMNVSLFTGNRPFNRPKDNFRANYWTAVINNIPAGQSEAVVPWEQFVNPTAPELKLNPLNAFKIEFQQADGAAIPSGVASWSFVTGAERLKPAWEQIVVASRPADKDGWREGIPSDGFGRFGWTESSGLLVGDLAVGQFKYLSLDRQNKGRLQTFTFFDGEEGRRLIWNRTNVDWTSVVHQTLYDQPATIQWADEKGRKPVPTSLTYSILAPGFLVDSDQRCFAFGIANKDAGSPNLLYADSTGLRWASSKEALHGKSLSEGWLVAVWPDQPHMPILFAPKHRPLKIQAKGGILLIQFEGSLDRIAVGAPGGFRWWQGAPNKLDQHAQQLAGRSRTLAAILRAYPKTCDMRFKDEKTSVLIRETFGHVVWSNEWNEPSTAIAPVSPMISFAKDMGYPLEVPHNLKDLDIPTKVGPYRYVDGATVEYRLSVPPTNGRMYLRPDGADVLADDIAGKITQKPSARNPRWLENTTNLAPWMGWAPRSLGLTLMNESQRTDFLDSWKMVLEDAFKPNPWYVRTEPWSGQNYIYSFAWMNSTNRTLGDIISGNGAILYASNLFARASGDWEMIERNWPLLNAVMQHYRVQHDWLHMQVPCHESEGSTAFDMELIGYLGAVGYLRMAETLGKHDDEAMGRLIVARLSVPLSMRWLGAKWVAPDLCKAGEVPFSSPGITDGTGFVREQSPHWHIGMSLTWKGPFYEAFAAQLWGAGESFWRFFEGVLIENIQPSLWTEKSWYRTKNVAAHLYMRGLLGAPVEDAIKELKRQGELGIFGMSPKAQEAQLYAPLYAMVVGRQFPVIINDWGRAALVAGSYDKTTKKATIKFDCDREFTATLVLTQPAVGYSINGKPMGTLTAGNNVSIELPAGTVALEISF